MLCVVVLPLLSWAVATSVNTCGNGSGRCACSDLSEPLSCCGEGHYCTSGGLGSCTCVSKGPAVKDGAAAPLADDLDMHSVDANHCHQLRVYDGANQSTCFQSWWAVHAYQYASFLHGLCPQPFDQSRPADVTHICNPGTLLFYIVGMNEYSSNFNRY